MQMVFCVRDRKAQTFNRPFFDLNKVQAQRSFHQACMEPKTPFSLYPDDYELLYLGTFDDRTGKFDILGFPEILCSPRDFESSAPASGASPRLAQ